MSTLEARDISLIPTPEIRGGISMRARSLDQKGLLPNGLQQLIVGSVGYRRRTLFFNSGANQGHFAGDPELNRLWKEWLQQYDGYSGDNLAATASYQHKRYDDPTDKRFPNPETPEFSELVKQMEKLGELVKELTNRGGWQVMLRTLYEIDLEILVPTATGT